LIQNKADGKLVELPSAAASVSATPREGGLGPSQADALSAEKIEAIGIEYSYLLTSQLDSQRSFYEEQTAELKTQVDQLKTLIEKLSEEFKCEKEHSKEEEQRIRREEEEKVAQALKEKTKADSRAEKVTELARRLEKELREERAVSEGLMKNLGKLREKVEAAERENENFSSKMRDLEDQLRDVMFSLDAHAKIEQGGGLESEAAGGSIEVPVPPFTPTSTTKKKTRKK